MIQTAQRYSNALFELAMELDQIDKWKVQLDETKVVFDENEELIMFLKNYKITNDDKKLVLNKIFEKRLDKYLINFLNLIIDKGRANIIRETLKSFHSICNEHNNISEGIVFSITPLDKKQLLDIENAISLKFDKKVSLRNRIDKRLISGVKVIVEDVVIDGSMKNKIINLKQELIKESR